MSKNFTFLFMLVAAFLFIGNGLLKAQTEVWNQAHAWNIDRYYRGVDYHPLNNHLYVAGTEGISHSNGALPEDNLIQILDASTGLVVKTISPASVLVPGEWGYGIRDVEVDDAGGIYTIISTSNTYNPVQLIYWADEDAEPVELWKDSPAAHRYFGGAMSVYGSFEEEALILIPVGKEAIVYYFEVVDGVLGELKTLDLNGLGAVETPNVQALGTKITDGFCYNNYALTAPVKFDGNGDIVATLPDEMFTTVTTGDTKYFEAGSAEMLVVSDSGDVQVIDITGKAEDLSDVTISDLIASIDGTVTVFEGTGWPEVYGDGQEQAVIGNPDGSYAIFSLSGGNYVKLVSTEGAPSANNLEISGVTMVDEVLSAEYVYVDINADAEGATEFTWYVADDAEGSNKTAISGASTSTFTITAAEEGKFISCSVLPVAATGTVSSPLHLAETALLGPVVPAGSEAPTASALAITGPIAVNEVLVGSYTYNDANGDAEGESILNWYKADDAAGANKELIAEDTTKYLVLPADEGKFIIFEVTPVTTTGALLVGETVEVVSDSAVFFPEIAPFALDLSISGREEVAGILTGTYTYSDLNGDEEGSSLYKWYRADDAEGTGKTEVASDVQTYTLVAADEGKYILFEVTPVTVDSETGDAAMVATGIIAAEPAAEAPVASDVAVNGIPEVGVVLYGSYTYSDRTDDPEGNSVTKWYTADDASGTNATLIDGEEDYTLIITEAMVGKYIAYEITPVATVGELLEGTPVMVVSADAAIADANDGDFDRIWMRAVKADAKAEYIGTGSTERGFAVGEDHIYVASRNGGTKLLVVDKETGGLVSEMNTDGMDVGLFKINDVELSDDGQILACPLETVASSEKEFVIYKWTDELAAPTKFITFNPSVNMRMGDKFTVTGDVSGDAVIYAAGGGTGMVVRWVVSGGVPDAGTEIQLGTLTSLGSTPAVSPFSASADADMLVDGRGLQAQVFDKDGTYKYALEGVGDSDNQSNSPTVFTYKGRTLVAFHEKNASGTWDAIIKDITDVNHTTVGTSEVLGTANQELGGVHVEVDEDYFHVYMLSTNQGLARFQGMLEFPEFNYAETNEAGDTINIWFSKNMIDVVDNANGWTVLVNDVAVAVDTITLDAATPEILSLTLETAVVAGDVITVAYDGSGPVTAADAMPLEAFTAQKVENTVGAAVPTASDVAITGNLFGGATLTGVYTFADANGDAEGNSTYQWYYASDDAGSDALKVLGAKELTYVVANDMKGKYLAFEVTPVAAGGGLEYLAGVPVMSDYVAIATVGVEQEKAILVNAYPNPVAGMLTVDNCAAYENIAVIDLTGRVQLHMQTRNANRFELNMADLQEGVYFLKLSNTKGEAEVLRIVKAD
jgi:Secretion system C-terminal sorting domain